MHGARGILVVVAILLFITGANACRSPALSAAVAMLGNKGGRRSSPFPQVKGGVTAVAEALLNLPSSGVWIHEKALYNIIKVPSGDKFGPRHGLSFLIEGIKKGY